MAGERATAFIETRITTETRLMQEHVELNAYDIAVFIAYMLATVVIGFWVARKGRGTIKNYFLGGKTIPWFVVGASMVATDISSEHFIANVGAAYKYGIVPATGSWNTWIIYSILILVFLPYYMRSGLYTMPQFLERRYSATCRYIFSLSLIVGYVGAIIAGSLYAGGIALKTIFGLEFDNDVYWGIVFFAIATGAYTVYGGLRSTAWTDFMQMAVLLVAGLLVPILALQRAGGLHALVNEYPQKFQVFLPPTDRRFPVTGVFTGFLTVGLWYSCTSQHMVQRVLSAKDEWNARMGVIFAGFLHIITPAFFVLPGVAAFKLFPGLKNTDHAYLLLVKSLVPAGLKGLILAGLAAALMSTVSTVVNSTSTLFTIDLYRKIWRPDATEAEQVRVGRISGAIALAIGVFIAFYFAQAHESLFVLVQNIFFYIAPPFAVIFLLGLLWRRANAPAAVATIVLGFAFTFVLDRILFKKWDLLKPYDAYQHRAILAWAFCMAVMIIVSLLTSPPTPQHVEGIIWTRQYARLPADEAIKYSGLRDYRIWWALFVMIVLGIYAFYLWFRFQHPLPP